MASFCAKLDCIDDALNTDNKTRYPRNSKYVLSHCFSFHWQRICSIKSQDESTRYTDHPLGLCGLGIWYFKTSVLKQGKYTLQRGK